MIHFIFWLVFVAFIAFVLRSKGWKVRLAKARDDGKYWPLSLFLLLRGGAALLVLALVGIISPIMDINFDISSEMLIGFCVWFVWLGYGGFAYFNGVYNHFHEQQLQKESPRKREGCFIIYQSLRFSWQCCIRFTVPGAASMRS